MPYRDEAKRKEYQREYHAKHREYATFRKQKSRECHKPSDLGHKPVTIPDIAVEAFYD